MSALGALRSTGGVLAPPRRHTRRISARRLRAITRAAVQTALELRDPLVLPGDQLGELLDLAIHPQQHLDLHLAALVIDRFCLCALHTPKFDSTPLCPTDPLNAYVKTANSGEQLHNSIDMTVSIHLEYRTINIYESERPAFEVEGVA
jgi:hypothetical protein